MLNTEGSTIVALSTPRGYGGIALIRMSGPLSLSILKNIFRSDKKIAPRQATLGRIFDDKGFIDSAVSTYYKAPHSYTGEDVVELSVHGNPFLCDLIIAALKKHGASGAGPGEFTKRAFLNGKMDLSQAEGVADFIYLSSRAALNASADLLRGSFGGAIRTIKSEIIDVLTVLELELDFTEEEIEFSSQLQTAEKVSGIIKRVEKILKTFDFGKIIREGLLCPIVGPPNSGKSSLFNALLKEERVIVSPTPGTTRDYIEETVPLGNYQIRLIDTAGIRKTKGNIEGAGIKKTQSLIKRADILLFVIDPINLPKDLSGLPKIQINKSYFIINKADIASPAQIHAAIHLAGKRPYFICSAVKSEGINKILDFIKEKIEKRSKKAGDHILTRERHKEALYRALQHLKKSHKNLLLGVAPEIISIDFRSALNFLDVLLGKTENDDILNNIFNNFCVGK